MAGGKYMTQENLGRNKAASDYLPPSSQSKLLFSWFVCDLRSA